MCPVPRRYRPDRPLWNLYGPTEATCSCTVGDLQPGKPVDIGISLPSFRCFVVAPNTLVQLPDGQAGELVVTGISVGRGYLNRPEKTAEQFTILPAPHGGVRCYRTGDKAVVLDSATGAFTLLGRHSQAIGSAVILSGRRIHNHHN